MWGQNKFKFGGKALCPLPTRAAGGNPIALMAAKLDTDHTTGSGQVAITGLYSSRKESFSVDAAYAVDDANTVYATYGVTDEKLSSVGIESGFSAMGTLNTMDLAYNPSNDSANLKLGVRKEKVKLSGFFSFDNVQKSNMKEHRERFQFEAVLSPTESLKMSFDGNTKASKVKLSRKLDPKNKLDAEYNYVDSSNKYMNLTFKHQYSKMHTFSVNTNYGSRRYMVEWDCKTENGPWTISTSFPFNSSPHKGDWMLQRRFEF